MPDGLSKAIQELLEFPYTASQGAWVLLEELHPLCFGLAALFVVVAVVAGGADGTQNWVSEVVDSSSSRNGSSCSLG